MNKPVFLMVWLCISVGMSGWGAFCEAASGLFLGCDALYVMSPGKLVTEKAPHETSPALQLPSKRENNPTRPISSISPLW